MLPACKHVLVVEDDPGIRSLLHDILRESGYTVSLAETGDAALEQMRQAQEQGATLKELAARLGLEVGHLYEIRRRLVRKGAFGPVPRRKTRIDSP